MSHKKYRTPAIVNDAEWSGEVDADAPTESATAASHHGAAPGIPMLILPDDYMTNGFHGTKPRPPGVYRTADGAGAGVLDLRARFGAIESDPALRKPPTEAEIALYNGDAMRFLWQVVAISSQILQSIPLGEMRRIVAGDMAEPGDIVREDGTVSKHPDAFEIGEDGNEAEARKRASEASTPPKGDTKRKSAGNARGRAHPIMAMIRMAIQSARLIKQITSGTYSKLNDRATERRSEIFAALEDAEKWLDSMKT